MLWIYCSPVFERRHLLARLVVIIVRIWRLGAFVVLYPGKWSSALSTGQRSAKSGAELARHDVSCGGGRWW